MIILQLHTLVFLHSIYFGFYLIYPDYGSKKSTHFFAVNFYFLQHLSTVNKAINNLIYFLLGASETDKSYLQNYTKEAFSILKKYFLFDCIFSKFFKVACTNQYLNHPVAIVTT